MWSNSDNGCIRLYYEVLDKFCHSSAVGKINISVGMYIEYINVMSKLSIDCSSMNCVLIKMVFLESLDQ